MSVSRNILCCLDDDSVSFDKKVEILKNIIQSNDPTNNWNLTNIEVFFKTACEKDPNFRILFLSILKKVIEDLAIINNCAPDLLSKGYLKLLNIL